MIWKGIKEIKYFELIISKFVIMIFENNYFIFVFKFFVDVFSIYFVNGGNILDSEIFIVSKNF